MISLPPARPRSRHQTLQRWSTGDGISVEYAPIRRGRPALLDTDIGRADQETRYFLDMDEVQRQFWAHWENTGKPEFKKGVAQAFLGFTKRKYGQMKHGKLR